MPDGQTIQLPDGRTLVIPPDATPQQLAAMREKLRLTTGVGMEQRSQQQSRQSLASKVQPYDWTGPSVGRPPGGGEEATLAEGAAPGLAGLSTIGMAGELKTNPMSAIRGLAGGIAGAYAGGHTGHYLGGIPGRMAQSPEMEKTGAGLGEAGGALLGGMAGGAMGARGGGIPLKLRVAGMPVEGEVASGYKPSEKATSLAAKTRDYGPEFNAQQWQEEINRNQSIIRNPNATPEEVRIATERLRDAQQAASGAERRIITPEQQAQETGLWHAGVGKAAPNPSIWNPRNERLIDAIKKRYGGT